MSNNYLYVNKLNNFIFYQESWSIISLPLSACTSKILPLKYLLVDMRCCVSLSSPLINFLVSCQVTLGVTSLLTLSTQHANSQKSLPPVSYIKVNERFYLIFDTWRYMKYFTSRVMHQCNLLWTDNNGIL